MVSLKPVLAITIGDPSGSGPELALKAALDKNVRDRCIPVVLGSLPIISDALQRIGSEVAPQLVGDQDLVGDLDGLSRNDLNVLTCGRLRPEEFEKGTPSAACGQHSVEVATLAAHLAMEGRVNTLCTAPTSKVSLHQAGYSYSGMTDLFQEITGAEHIISMLVMDNFRMVLATSHIPFESIAKKLNRQKIAELTIALDSALKNIFGISEPRVGVAGLNPHAGEGGLYGRDEIDVIEPAIRDARERGVQAVGPIPADFLVPRIQTGELDGAVMMYHDQAQAPLKVLGCYKPATLLLGMPIIRTSVAHGTAYGKAHSGTADPSGMIQACTLAAFVAQRKERHA